MNSIVSSILLALNDKARIVIFVVCALVLVFMIIAICYSVRKKKRVTPEKQEVVPSQKEEPIPEEPEPAPALIPEPEPEPEIEELPAEAEEEPEEPVAEEPVKEVTLSESLAAAKDTGAAGIVTKKSIIDHLASRFGDKVELNARANKTPNGKLLMSDNHFAFTSDGKRVCFTYIYQDDDGDIIILLRTTTEHAQAIRAAHKATGVRSSFPKNKEKDWYSVVVDDTFSEKEVYDVLDQAALNIIGKASVPEEAPAEVSLKESLAEARDIGAVGVVTKKTIIEHLSSVYGDKVELNGRENKTPNGKLLMSDNHFALAEGKRVCFTYIYEDEGKVMMLVRLSEQGAAAVRAAHKATGVKSAFPKNKDKDWYSVIVDDTFTAAKVYAVLEESYRYALTK